MTECTTLDITVTEEYKPSKCCRTHCNNLCSECRGKFDTCYDLIDNAIEGECCNGYECCSRYKNKCISSAINELCEVKCTNHHGTTVKIKYVPTDEKSQAEEDGYIYYDYYKNCGCGYDNKRECAEDYATQFPNENTTSVCWYLPGKAPTYNNSKNVKLYVTTLVSVVIMVFVALIAFFMKISEWAK